MSAWMICSAPFGPGGQQPLHDPLPAEGNPGTVVPLVRWVSGAAKRSPMEIDSTWHSVTSEATVGEVRSRSTRLRKPLVNPVASATC